MDLCIIPECYVDTNLIETLVPTNTGYNHQMGCGTVASKMQGSFADQFALGIIDKDKKELDYMKQFFEIASKGNLRLFKHKTRHHYMIQICPAIERFLLENVKLAGLSMNDYGLPEDLDRLKKHSKTTRTKNDDKFKSLFKALRRAETPDIMRLTNWVSYLKENCYQANVEALRAI